MSSKSNRDTKKVAKNLNVTSRCVAIVFKRIDKDENKNEHGCQTQNAEVTDEHLELHADYDNERNEADPYLISPKVDGNCQNSDVIFDAKKVLDEFKFRNKTCYWNPALVDSVNSLEYVGFLEPLTVLVKGDDIHLENIRTAWGRRVLKDPAHFKIEKIGDVNGIEMQVVPQTQFIPLPEALCLIIMELNNNQIVATLDTVCDRLGHCYQGLHLPGNQHVYETLGTLIRERKVFHTGCGYFVVTPDTFRMHGDDLQATPTLLSPWTHLHPMYIPAAFSQPPRQPTRSISCQVDAEGTVIGQKQSHDTIDKPMTANDQFKIDQPAPRVQRSMSLSVRRPRDRGRKDEVSEGSLRRSSSVKGRNEKPGKQGSKDDEIKVENKRGKSKDKQSFFSKIFGKSKKKEKATPAPPPEPKKPVKEYATFSAQFPPPEWMWYQQQLDKHVRTETWVQQQVRKSGTWHHLQSVPTDFCGTTTTSIHIGSNSVPERATTLPNTQNSVPTRASRRANKKAHKHRERTSMVIANTQQGGAHIDADDEHTFRNSMGQSNIKLSSLPTRLSPGSELMQSNYTTSHPMFSSTPRYSTIHERYSLGDEHTHTQTENKESELKNGKSHSQRKSQKTKKKSHHDRHSSFNPSSRHVSGMSANPGPDIADISYEYQGRLPQKHSAKGLSHSSGVNCIGLDNEQGHQGHVKGHSNPRSMSYRHVPGQHHEGLMISDEQRQFQGQMPQRSMSYRHSHSKRELPNFIQGQQHERSKSYRHTPVPHEHINENGNHDTVNDAHIYANVHVENHRETKPKLPERITTYKPKPYTQTHDICTRNGRVDKVELKLPAKFVSHQSQSLCSHMANSDQRFENNSDRGTVNSGSSHGPSSQDSALEGTESSEQSQGTVIHRKSLVNKHMDRLAAETRELTLGDSGFSSPRVSENSNDSKRGDCNLTKEQNGGFMCNNLKNGLQLNNSVGGLDEFSDESCGMITSDVLYENVKINHREVLNNMKYLHKEINVSSQNLNMPQTTQESPCPMIELDPKQPVVKKFNFEGDFHVVGVV